MWAKKKKKKESGDTRAWSKTITVLCRACLLLAHKHTTLLLFSWKTPSFTRSCQKLAFGKVHRLCFLGELSFTLIACQNLLNPLFRKLFSHVQHIKSASTAFCWFLHFIHVQVDHIKKKRVNYSQVSYEPSLITWCVDFLVFWHSLTWETSGSDLFFSGPPAVSDLLDFQVQRSKTNWRNLHPLLFTSSASVYVTNPVYDWKRGSCSKY